MARVDGWRRLAAAALDWRPSERLRVTLDAEHVARDIAEPTGFALTPRGGRVTLRPLPPSDRNLGARWMRASGWRRDLLLRGRYALAPGWSGSPRRVAARSSARLLLLLRRWRPARRRHRQRADHPSRSYHTRLYQADLAGTITDGLVVHYLLLGAAERPHHLPALAAALSRDAELLPTTRPPAPAPGGERQRVDDAGLFLLDRAAAPPASVRLSLASAS
ncbi:hypothetical protein K7957_13765 [Sphingomonas yunnanensis]|uniref:hypothetical protein n=1 Tax=Sphingomonas yunnanensis TaxID=310400 RepID=UPI001CA65A83|nr:hypothetical protein [Sphingomonas yunnanensis]MBY9064007.1 hypothetical protein [Sphingomonas yunnanensis]